MSERAILRPRPTGWAARARRARHGLSLARIAATPRMAAPGPMPVIGFTEPESRRADWISGSLSALLHAALIGGIVVAAWMAPEVVEEKLIEVKLLEERIFEPVELPGSNTPSGGPKSLSARAPASAAALAAAMAAAQPAPAPRAVADLSARALEMAAVPGARAPTEVRRSALEAARVDARPEVSPAPRALDVATLSPVAVDPSAIRAPQVDLQAPKAIGPAQAPRASAAESFAGYQAAPAPTVTGRAAAVANAAPTPAGGQFAGRVGADTAVSGAYLSGSAGPGGAGVGPGSGEGGAPTVECLQSAYVHRYMKELERRTYARWEEPPETAPDSVVKLRFRLDVTGSPTAVEFIEASNEVLGRSAVEALRSAAPFPPMDANVRCLAERSLTATFTANPSS